MASEKKAPHEDDLLTPTEVARLWRKSPEFVRKRCRLGELTHIKFGKRDYMLRRADVDAYVADHLKRSNEGEVP